MSFANLKQQSKNVNELTEKLKKLENKRQTYTTDERFWQPTVDSAGNGNATIRFLPAVDGEDTPFLKTFEFSFQHPTTKKWYIEKSPTTINQPDYAFEYVQKLWSTDTEASKDLAKKLGRRTYYISNILVVNDPEHPENNGQVKLFKYGHKIYEKIRDYMYPEDEDKEPEMPSDFWRGRNFRLKVRKVAGYRNYDKSSFDEPKPIFVDENGLADENKMEVVWGQQYKLSEFTSPDAFKSYDELKANFLRAIGGDEKIKSQSNDDIDDDLPDFSSSTPTALKANTSNGGKLEESVYSSSSVDDEDDEDFLRGLGIQ